MRYLRGALWAITIVVMTGCARVNLLQSPVADVRPQREEQQRATVESFEKKRTTAELRSAQMRFMQGDVEGCRQAIESLLRRQPDHAEACLLLAEVLLASNKPQQAENVLQELVLDQPGNAAAHIALGDLLVASGREMEAQTLWEKAQTLEPNNLFYASNHAEIKDRSSADFTGKSHQFDNVSTQRLTTITSAIDSATSHRGQEFLAKVLEITKGDTAGLRNAVHAAIGCEPHNPNMLNACAVHAIRVEQPQLAVAILTTGTTRFPVNMGILRSLGAAYLQVGDAQAARAVLQQAVSLDKDDPLSYFLLGHSLALMGKRSRADEMFRKASQRDARYAQ